MIKVERRRAEVGGVRIHYKVAGAGEPVVLIHGLSGSSRWWGRNMGALARRFRVFSIDLIGFGGSRGRQRFVLSEASEYVALWMQRTRITRAHVFGHSMGGYIAAELAANHPDCIRRLILVDAAAVPFGRSHARNVLGLAHASVRLPFSFWPILVTDALRAGPLTILSAAHELLTADMTEDLRRIQAPTLIIWGQHDTLVPEEIGHRIQACIPSSELVVMKRAGHNPMWDRPHDFNALAINFLANTER
jgi:pimeloyl-ACP methyl ester carboxylesterase